MSARILRARSTSFDGPIGGSLLHLTFEAPSRYNHVVSSWWIRWARYLKSVVTSSPMLIRRIVWPTPPPPDPPSHQPFYDLDLVTTRSATLLFPPCFALLTAAFSTVMTKRKVTAKELLARAESNEYKGGIYQEQNINHDENKHG